MAARYIDLPDLYSNAENLEGYHVEYK